MLLDNGTIQDDQGGLTFQIMFFMGGCEIC